MAFAKINKSGCGERHGNVQVRIDFYLEPTDPRYNDTYIDVPVLNDKGEPTSKTKKQLNPFHSHFMYFSPDVTEAEILKEAEYHLPNFYTAFQNEWDKSPGGMRHGWDTATRVRPARKDKTLTSKDFESVRLSCEAKITELTEASTSVNDLEGREYPATEIDIGSPAINRGGSQASGNTILLLENPANDTGVIDTVEIWVLTAISETVVGTLYLNSGTNYIGRDYESIGTVTSGSKQTFSGLDIDVETGDYIGSYATAGRYKSDYSGYAGIRENASGNTWSGGSTKFDTLQSGDTLSIYGTGETTAPTEFELSCTDGISAGDSPSKQMVCSLYCTEGMGIGDSAGKAHSANPVLSEVISLSGALSTSMSAQIAASDGVAIGEALSEYILAHLTTSDGLTLSDSALYFLAYYLSAADGVALSDIPLGVWSADVALDNADEALTYFPVYLNISEAAGKTDVDLTSIFDEIGDSYLKLRVRTDSGEDCYVEVVSWSAAERAAELHCKVPAISNVSGAALHISASMSFANNSDYVGLTGSAPAQAVWDSSFVFVSHMNDNPAGDGILDSTSNANHGTKGAGAAAPIEVDGLVGKAQSFDGIDDLINLPDSYNYKFTGQFQYEVYAKTNSISTGYRAYFTHRFSGTSSVIGLWQYAQYIYIEVRNNGRTSSITGTNGNALSVNTDDYYYLGIQRDASNDINVIQNGSLTNWGNVTGDITDANLPVGIGVHQGTTPMQSFDGLEGEFRISSTARGAGWIAYTNGTLRDSVATYTVSYGAYTEVNPSAIDGLEMSDSCAEAMEAFCSGLDSILASDAPVASMAAAVSAATGIILSDQAVKALEMFVEATEGLVVSDAAVLQSILYLLASSGITASDDTALAVIIYSVISEGIRVSDSPSSGAKAEISVADGLTLSDVVARTIQIYLSISDGMTLSDAITAYLKAYRIIQTISARARTSPSNWRPIVDEGNKRNLK